MTTHASPLRSLRRILAAAGLALAGTVGVASLSPALADGMRYYAPGFSGPSFGFGGARTEYYGDFTRPRYVVPFRAQPRYGYGYGSGYRYGNPYGLYRYDRREAEIDRNLDEIRDSRRDIRGDRSEIRELRRDLRRADSRRERREIQSDIRQNRREIRREREDIRGDRNELRDLGIWRTFPGR